MHKSYLNTLLNRTKLFLSQSGSNSNIILKSWIQNRLREYFVIQSMRYHNTTETGKYSPVLEADQFDVMCHELRVLEVEIHHSEDEQERFDYFIDIMMGINPKDRPSRSEHKNYRTGKALFTVTYQENGNSTSTEMLNLITQVGEIDDVDFIDVHPFVPYSEKHAIDIYTKVFPTLEDWVTTMSIEVTFSIPKCYFGKYEDTRKVSIDQIISTENDIMSKVATGMRISEEIPKLESHRILILENVEIDGFERKNVNNTTFLPLANVQAALKEIALIHCASWAFTEVTKKQFTCTWPFLTNNDYLPYLMIRASQAFVEFLDHAENHLAEVSAPDTDDFLSTLHSLNSQLTSTLAKVTIPSAGPVCLIHQNLSYSTILFRHSLIPHLQDDNYTEDEPRSEFSAEEPRGYFKHKEEKQRRQKDLKNSEQSQSTSKISEKKTTGLLVKREVRITDWKHSTLGSPMNDIAYLILTSLPPKTRRSETQNLLKFYWTEFEEITSSFQLSVPWNLKELYREYLHSLLYACILMITNFQINNNLLEVVLDALRELKTHEVI